MLKAIRHTNDFLYAVGQIAHKKLKKNRARVEQIEKFVLDILVLAREKTKIELKKRKIVTATHERKEWTAQVRRSYVC